MGKSTICRFQGFLKHFDQITFGGGRRMQQLLTWSTSPIETSSCYKLRARLSRHTTPSSAIEKRILKWLGIEAFLNVHTRRQILAKYSKYFAKYSPVIPYPCLGEPPFSALTKINVVIIKCIPHNDKPILTKCSTPQYINKIQWVFCAASTGTGWQARKVKLYRWTKCFWCICRRQKMRQNYC